MKDKFILKNAFLFAGIGTSFIFDLAKVTV